MEMQHVEAVVLTGGRSRRMGTDKAQLSVDGVPQAKRIVSLLRTAGMSVTVLGREPVDGADFVPDGEEFAGPLQALSRYEPSSPLVFVASCDLPRFDAKIVELLRRRIHDAQAAIPVVDGFRQPFCGLYSAEAFQRLSAIDDPCAMGWLDALQVNLVLEADLISGGVHPATARGANTPEEFARALQEDQS